MESLLNNIVNEKWNSLTSSDESYTGAPLRESWNSRVSSILTERLSSLGIQDIRTDVIKFYTNVDEFSLLQLWYSVGSIDESIMDLSGSRKLVSHVLKLRGLELDRSNYTAVFEEYLLYLNADVDSGLIEFDDFVDYFPLWYVSRLWPTSVEQDESRKSSIVEIIKAWDNLDISDSGLISRGSMERILLPFAFGLLYSDGATNLLRDRWVRFMLKVLDCTRSDWVNHWMEFMFMDPLKFNDIVPTGSNQNKVNAFVEDALTFLGLFPMTDDQFAMHVSDYLSLVSQSTSSADSRSRAAVLWLVSRNTKFTRNFIPSSIGEKSIPKEPIIEDWTVLRDSLTDIWNTYFPAGETGCMQHQTYFDIWTERITRGLNQRKSPKLLILRKSLCDKFISQLETETLWDEYVGRKSTRIPPHKLIRLLHGVYKDMYKEEQTSEGNWVVREWLEDITALALLIPDNHPDVIITKDVFLIVFPIWYSSVFPVNQPSGEEHIDTIWPISAEKRVIFSEPNLRTLLEKMWNSLMPADIGLPCHEWWLMRCCNKLARISGGRGVTRQIFCSLFFSPDEVNYIYEYYQVMNSQNLTELLHHCIDQDQYPDLPTEIVEEFFLIADNPPARSGGAFVLPHSTFVFAFPLWAAAHAN